MIDKEKFKNKKGCWPYVIGFVAVVAVLRLLEWGAQEWYSIANPEPLSRLLTPFHNNYFSFSPYFITEPGMATEFTSSPSATIKFTLLALIGCLVFAILSTIINFLPGVKKIALALNKALLALLLVICLSLGFFIPKRITVFDPTDHTLNITHFKYGLYPYHLHIPAGFLQEITYKVSSGKDFMNRRYVYYLSIYAKAHKKDSVRLGEMQVGEYAMREGPAKNWKTPPEIDSLGTRVVHGLNELLQLHPGQKQMH